ncbi:MAG: cell division protein FtsK [Clostridiales bacterium]|nr:MAG: cell division protein FtsK [Clostridiales bacterium]
MLYLFIFQSIVVGIIKYDAVIVKFYTLEGINQAYQNGVSMTGAGCVGNLIFVISKFGFGMVGSVVLSLLFGFLFLIYAFDFKFSKLLINTKNSVVKGGKIAGSAGSSIVTATKNKINQDIINSSPEKTVDTLKYNQNIDEVVRNTKNNVFSFINIGENKDLEENILDTNTCDKEKYVSNFKPINKSETTDRKKVKNKLDEIIRQYDVNKNENEQNENLDEILADESTDNDFVNDEVSTHNENSVDDEISVDDDLIITEFEKDEETLNFDETEDVKSSGDKTLENENFISIDEYKLPDIDLLIKSEEVVDNTSKNDILNKARLLENTFKMFKIDAKVVEAKRGPMITRFEVQPMPGVKISKISSLSDDIALNLAATNVRILAPIPGKAAVGIEVPNKTTSVVRLREVLESDEYKKRESLLRFGLGKSISGKEICADLSKMPHLLIAGATGSGKSVCVNTIITSILFNSRPDEVKFLMIDPKVVELSIYNGIPHLILPVVTDANKASSALNWAVVEMNNRYKKFAELGVRNINGYNEKLKSTNYDKPLPRIVIIIDELADLMIVAKKQVEDLIARITQMARAAGIHLIVATQRPSVDVITGVIKSNIPSRIAFAVSSYIDSRTIIDEQGAEKLLGKGDMLFLNAGESRPIRVQGSFVTDEEVEKLVTFVKSQQIENIEENVEEIIMNSSVDYDNLSDDEDDLLKPAIDFVISQKKASTSMVQRRFKIGYNRAARLIDEMEDREIIGQSRGSKPREVLVDSDDTLDN